MSEVVKITKFKPVVTARPSSQMMLRVTRNIVEMLPEFSKFEINLVLAILWALSDCKFDPQAIYGEIQNIPIPYAVIAQGHHSQDILKALVHLSSVKVRYSYTVPGVDADIQSNVISAITKCNGRYFVDIPGKTIPWLLYFGKGVGYAYVEWHLALMLPEAEKRLYLYIMSRYNPETKVAVLTLSVAELARRTGFFTERYARINERVISPLIEHMKTQSKYELEATPVLDHRTGRGRRAVTSLMLTLREKKNSQNVLNSLTDLRRCLEIVKNNVAPNLKISDVELHLLNEGLAADFVDRCHKLKPTEVRLHLGRKISQILKNEYQIDIKDENIEK